MAAQSIYSRVKKGFVLFPGAASPTSAVFLRDYYADRSRRRSAARTAIDAAVCAGFRLWLPWRARQVATRYGLSREWASKAAAIGRARFADPNDLALFRIDCPSSLDHYLRRFEHEAINRRLNRRLPTAACALENKLLFADRCAAHGLAHPDMIATIMNGSVAVQAARATAEIVVKPADGEGGRGVLLATLTEEDRADPRRLTSALAARFGTLRGRWLVQPRIAGHPELADLALDALATVRISTMLNERGEPEIVTSVLRFPARPGVHVDNIKAGGMMAPVDPVEGALGLGCVGRGLGDLRVHPASGARIEGRQLPDWKAAVALALRAHTTFDDVLIGWDVALTPEGPMLIEGNVKPCMIVAQRATRAGVGATRFGELIAYHLRG